MTLHSKFLAAATGLAAIAVAGCASTGDREAAEVAEADAVLAGFQASGETRSCLPLRSIDEIEPLDADRWLVRMRNDDVYLTQVSRGCSQATSDFTYLQYNTTGSSLCANQIVRVLDRGTNMISGSCGLGRFQALDPVDEGA